METNVALVGFGEAAAAFAEGAGWQARAFDIKTDATETRLAKLADYQRYGVHGTAQIGEALDGAHIILSLVTADQALAAAEQAATHLSNGTLYLDMNSVAPGSKQQAAAAIHAAGARYVDVAVMAPVYPQKRAVPLLVSGADAAVARAALVALGFTNVRALPGDVGRASSVKMIRSVMIKGVEALTAEMMQGAAAAGVAAEVLASLGPDWDKKAAYNLERMATHGARRAAEMEEAAKTLVTLGIDPVMTRGTILRQREMARMERVK